MWKHNTSLPAQHSVLAQVTRVNVAAGFATPGGSWWLPSVSGVMHRGDAYVLLVAFADPGQRSSGNQTLYAITAASDSHLYMLLRCVQVVLHDVSLRNNKADFGGAVCVRGNASVTAAGGCLVANNSALGGAGFDLNGYSRTTLVQVTFVNNNESGVYAGNSAQVRCTCLLLAMHVPYVHACTWQCTCLLLATEFCSLDGAMWRQ